MRKITVRRFLGLLAAVVLGLLMVHASGSDAKAAKGKQEVRVEGTLVGLDAATGVLSIRTKGGATLFIGVNAATKIERNGLKATLSSFKLNDFVQARFASAVTEPALKVEAKGP